MKALVNREMAIPLSTTDILKKVDTPIMSYDQFQNINDIETAFNGKDSLILLYETQPNFGHWTCLIKRGGTIEHFDSYGFFPDDEQNFAPEEFRDQYYNERPHLIDLLHKSGKKIRYNHHRLQGHGTNTCGRWCIMRIRLRGLDEDEFEKLFKIDSLSPDELVTLASIVI